MKKKLESELISIAHRILKLKGKEDVLKMHLEVSALFEKLSVLKFVHEKFDGDIPTIGSNSSFFGMLDQAFNNKVSDNIEVEDKIYVNLDESENESIMEPVIDKIKNMVAQMPQGMPIETIPKQKSNKNDLEDLTSGFENTPIFEPITKTENTVTDEKKSLNDKLKTGGLNIGLNDKIAFTKHLFNNNTEDYKRVISQINTLVSFSEAKHFIEDIVKPDYNNWEEQKELEDRFIEIVESKFN